jgi:hypothetical protein
MNFLRPTSVQNLGFVGEKTAWWEAKGNTTNKT